MKLTKIFFITATFLLVFFSLGLINNVSADTASDNVTVNVTIPPANCSVSPWGTINHGDSVTAYLTTTVPYGSSCSSQTRTCNDGTLSGTYTNDSCIVQPAGAITVSLSASRNPVNLPTNSSTISWSTSGSPTSCTASGAWTGVKSTSGGTESKTYSSAGTYTYSITCSKAGTSNATDSVTVVVNSQTVTNYTLTTSKSGSGTISSSPSGISCGTDCSQSYASGTSVSLSATPSSGYVFSGWGGSCSGTGSCTVSMTSNKTVTAVFTYSPSSYTLNISKTGTGTGTVTGSGISCGSDCSQSYTSGTSVTLIASATLGSFTGWSGCNSTSGSSCTVSMTSSKTVTASFTYTVTNYTLTTSKSGSGTISSSPSGISCGTDCSQSYASGTSVSLSATPSSGYVFSGWGGSCSGTGSCTVSMTSNKTVTAVFSVAGVPSGVISVNNCSIPIGSSSCSTTVTWATSNVDASETHLFRISPNMAILAFRDPSGTISSSISYGNTTFGIYYSANSPGSFLAQKTVTASCASGSSWNGSTCAVVTPITVNLTASPSSMNLPTNSTTLSWTTTGSPTSCIATQDWTGTPTAVPSGSAERTGMTEQTYNFGITCSKAGVADATSSTSVVVGASLNMAPSSPIITSDTTNYYKDVLTNFTFTSTDPENDQIRYGIDWDMNGSADIWLPETAPSVTYVNSGVSQTKNHSWSTTGAKTFQALAQDINGENSGWRTFDLSVVEQPVSPTASIDSDISVVEYNGKAVLSWTSSNATSCNLSGGGISPVVIGTSNLGYTTPSLPETTTFTLYCVGNGGDITKTITIMVGEIKPIFEER